MSQREHFHHPAKQKAREALGRAIRKQVIHHGQVHPSNIRVATLLGPPYKHELPDGPAEIMHAELEMYDQLKIPRKNIFAIERNRTRAQEIYDSGLIPKENIFFYEGTDALIPFLKANSSQKFEVINLDYEGYFDWHKKITIDRIVGRQNLAPTAVLCTTFLGAREKDEEKRLYKAIAETELSWCNFTEKYFEERLQESTVKSKAFLEEKQRIESYVQALKDDFSANKNKIIPKAVKGILMAGISVVRVPPLYKSHPDFQRIVRSFATKFSDTIVHNAPMMQEITDAYDIDIKEMIEIMAFSRGGLQYVDAKIMDSLRYASLPSYVLQFMQYSEDNSYFCRKFESYEYGNEKNMPMLVDIFSVEQVDMSRYKALAQYFWSIFNRGEFIMHLIGLSPDECRKMLADNPQIVFRKKVKKTKFGRMYIGKQKVLAKIVDTSVIPVDPVQEFFENKYFEVKDQIFKDFRSLPPDQEIPERVHLGTSYKPRLSIEEYARQTMLEKKNREEFLQEYNVTPEALDEFAAKLPRYLQLRARNNKCRKEYMGIEQAITELEKGKSSCEIAAFYKIMDPEGNIVPVSSLGGYKRWMTRRSKASSISQGELSALSANAADLETKGNLETLSNAAAQCFDENLFFDKMSSILADSESSNGSNGFGEAALEIAYKITLSDAYTLEQKQEFANVLKTAANGRPIRRVLEKLSQEKAQAIITSIGCFVEKNKVPTEAEIQKLLKQYMNGYSNT